LVWERPRLGRALRAPLLGDVHKVMMRGGCKTSTRCGLRMCVPVLVRGVCVNVQSSSQCLAWPSHFITSGLIHLYSTFFLFANNGCSSSGSSGRSRNAERARPYSRLYKRSSFAVIAPANTCG